MSSIVNKTKDKATDTSSSSNQHLAAILTSKASAIQVAHRPTPTPGPNELLIDVKSIALNQIDWYQRDCGFAIASYPAISGSDIAGIVVSAGASVPSDAPQPGTRICAFAPCFFVQGAPDYGALQTRVLVPAVNAVKLPQGMSFNEASVLPMAVVTAWCGWYSIGMPLDAAYTAADKEGMLVWGGASSIGSAAVQIARLMGFTVYTTASERHHEYLKCLGASKVFDYRGESVVRKVVDAAQEDGVTIKMGFDAVGQLKSCLEILKALSGEGPAKLASAVPLSEDSPTMEGVEVNFVAPPLDESERTEFFHFVFRIWLKEHLDKADFVPSPKIQVVDGGLKAAQKGLDELKKGVSGVKLVLEV